MPKISIHTSDRTHSLVKAIESQLGDTNVELLVRTAKEAQWVFSNADSEYALVSPLEYAAHQSDYSILTGACVSAVSATADILLVINKGLKTIGSLAVAGDSEFETVLAQIVLKEKFGLAPVIRSLSADILSSLHMHDAVLLTREDAASVNLEPYAVLDLVDEWFDLTQMPLVREIVIGWNDKIEPHIDAIVRAAGIRADANALEALQETANEQLPGDDIYLLPGHYRYLMDEGAEDSLNAFYRLAFFHGFLRDIPQLNFWIEEMVSSS
jgi:predicted solute-binding protein